MWTLYDNLDSGNGYKVRLALSQLEIPYRLVEVDSVHGETRTRAFLAKNPNGRVPLLEVEPGDYLPESNAILHYIASGSTLIPEGELARARMLSWMFFEQYSHEPYVATSRFILRHTPEDSPRRAELSWRQPRAHEALAVMEQQLAKTPFLCGRYSLADIALYAYTHRAHEGGIELAPYPAIRAWLTRVEATPRYVPMLS
ncbi:MAG: glutathione S-transferase family protein [Polyangiales bacterium]